jgi:hypothetical protein
MLGYLDDPLFPRNAYPAPWGPFALIGEGGCALGLSIVHRNRELGQNTPGFASPLSR